jgi:heptaprenyl diphosphate synthase
MKGNGMKTNIKKLTFLALSSALALVLSYLESLLPPIIITVPGIKIGLPNLVIICLLYRYGAREAAAVSLVRLIAIFMMFGGVTTMAYSLAGAVISLSLMALFKRLSLFSTVGVSVIGGVTHNLGQILVAVFLFDSLSIGYYMIVLAITGTVAGAFIGLSATFLLKRLNTLLK